MIKMANFLKWLQNNFKGNQYFLSNVEGIFSLCQFEYYEFLKTCLIFFIPISFFLFMYWRYFCQELPRINFHVAKQSNMQRPVCKKLSFKCKRKFMIDNQLIEMQNQSTKQKHKINTGRWTRAEHDKFMEALQKYGRDWARIQKKIKTRNLLQIRSHAQKVFLNMSETDIRAFIGSDQDSSFNTKECSNEIMKKKKLNSNASPPENISENLTKQKNQSENPQKIELRATYKATEGNSKQKLPDENSQQVVVSQVLNKRIAQEDNYLQNNSASFFIQLLKQNERHFMQGGNFLGLTWGEPPLICEPFIPIYPGIQFI